MILNLLKIRLIQIYRTSLGIGIWRALLVFFIIFPFVILFLYQQLEKTDNTHFFIVGIILYFILLIHRKRKDHIFLLKVSDSLMKTYYIEYVFFSTPFIILLGLTYRILDLGIYLFLLLIIILLIRPAGKRVKRTFMRVTSLIPDYMFEWKSGIRQHVFSTFFIYIIGVVGAILSIWVTFACIILLSIFIWSFNSICESREMLEAKAMNGKKFLIFKLQQHLICWSVFMLPLFLVACIHYVYIVYTFILFVTVTNTYICSILLKYAYYRPNEMSVTGSLYGNVVLLFSLVPGISVMVLVYNLFLYGKSVKKIGSYLNDYN